MPTKTQVLEILRQAQQDQQEFVARLSEAERQTIGSPDRWAAKDLLAHFGAWDELVVQRMAAVAAGEEFVGSEEVDDQNAIFFENHRGRSFESALAYARGAQASLIAAIEALPAVDLSDQKLGDRFLWRYVVGTGYTHPLTHYAQFASERGDALEAVRLYEQSLEWLEPLDNAPSWRGTIVYNLACGYAVAGEKTKALEFLREALTQAPELREWSKLDTDLVSLRGEPEYEALYRDL